MGQMLGQIHQLVTPIERPIPTTIDRPCPIQ